MTRRSLFGLIPGAFTAGLHGLLTTQPDVSPAPASDEVAEAALDLGDRVRTEAGLDRAVAQLRAQGSRRSAEIILNEVLAPCRLETAEAERDFRDLLALSRGVSVVIDGRVYSAGRSRSQIVAPVWVAMLTPAKGGGR